MTRLQAILGWIERTSDWLSPIVVKEVRQLARGREFHYSFSASLLVGLAVAFLGAADALSGSGTTGGWTFAALMGCLAILGLAVVPLGAFGALRSERLEQTFDLITLTTLSPRRVVIGKLLAQGVKLATLFAGLAPFVAMSFLLGGIDFTSILVSMGILFMWSLWACAACLFLSALPRTRAISGLLFGGLVLVLCLAFIAIGGPRMLFFLMSRGMGGGMSVSTGGGGSAGWLLLVIMTTFCLVTLGNLVLLAENRLSLPSDNKVTPLRVGFLVQFLLIVAWTLAAITEAEPVRARMAQMLGFLGGLHLAIVAIFTVTEDLVLPRRVLLEMQRRPAWWRLFAMMFPGGGRGALYVLAQMALLLGAVWLLHPKWVSLSWVVGLCGYILFFTGVPVAAFRVMRPFQTASFALRVAVIVLIPMVVVLPDVFFYMVSAPSEFDIAFSARHLLNPFRTLADWDVVQLRYGFAVPAAIGLTGLLAYALLIVMGRRITVQPVPIAPRRSAAAAGVPGVDSLS